MFHASDQLLDKRLTAGQQLFLHLLKLHSGVQAVSLTLMAKLSAVTQGACLCRIRVIPGTCYKWEGMLKSILEGLNSLFRCVQ